VCVPQPRILVGDDNETILERLKRLLNEEFDVVDAVGNGLCLIDRAVELKPDIVVADICMPGCGGVTAATEMKRRIPGTKLVFMSMIQSAGLCEDVLAAGALGYVLTERASTDLIAAVREALAGRSYVSPHATDSV
jgi:DNA-binding NarL/FixJ family response regulator